MRNLLFDLILLTYLCSCVAYFLMQSPLRGRAFWSRAGTSLLFGGMVMTGFYVLSRWMELGRFPLGHTFDFLMLLALAVSTAYFTLERLFAIRYAGPIALLMLVVAVSYAALFHGRMVPAIDLLGDNHWTFVRMALHVVAMAAFLVAFIVAAGGMIWRDLREKCDVAVYHAVLLGFPFYGVSTLMRAVWMNEQAGGSFFAGTLGDVLAILPLAIYFLYLHFKFVHRWRGIFVFALAIAGFAAAVVQSMRECGAI